MFHIQISFFVYIFLVISTVKIEASFVAQWWGSVWADWSVISFLSLMSLWCDAFKRDSFLFVFKPALLELKDRGPSDPPEPLETRPCLPAGRETDRLFCVRQDWGGGG